MFGADNLCRLSWNLEASTTWNPLGLFRPVMWLLYLLPFFSTGLRNRQTSHVCRENQKVDTCWLWLSFIVCCCSCMLLNAPKRSNVEVVSNDALSVFTPQFLSAWQQWYKFMPYCCCYFRYRLAFSWRHILISYNLSSQCMVGLRFKFVNQFQECSFSDVC